VPTTLVGAVIEALAADATLQAAFPGLAVYRDEVPEQVATLPHVVVTDDEEPYRWVNLSARVEAHRLRVQVYAAGGGVVGAAHPADVIADHLTRILNWEDAPIPGTTTVRFEQVRRPLKVQPRRAANKERVALVSLEYEVEFYRTGVAHAG
jgi:hypothetical protein